MDFLEVKIELRSLSNFFIHILVFKGKLKILKNIGIIPLTYAYPVLFGHFSRESEREINLYVYKIRLNSRLLCTFCEEDPARPVRGKWILPETKRKLNLSFYATYFCVKKKQLPVSSEIIGLHCFMNL